MPRIDRNLLNVATYKVVGGMDYDCASDRSKWSRARKLAGITKGQWKRFQLELKKVGDFGTIGPVASVEVTKRLEVMAKHGDSPHLNTLLRMIEVRKDDS